MTETVAMDPDGQLPGVFARAIGIITSPKATFELIVRKPASSRSRRSSALVMGASQSAFVATERGQQAMIDMQMQQQEKSTRCSGWSRSQGANGPGLRVACEDGAV